MLMKKVFVVDDDAMSLKMAEFILQQNNYAVIKASSGMEFLSMLSKVEVDLVLLDIEMPLMNGIKTLETMKKNEAFRDIPVMFLTANTELDTIKEAGKLGVSGYVKKPFLPQDLLDRVAGVIGK